MIGLFKERNPIIIPVLIFLALLLKFVFIRYPLPYYEPQSGGLLDQLILSSRWKQLHPGFLSIICFIILLFSGIFFNYLLAEKRMFHRSNLLTALCFVLLTSIFAGIQRMQAGIFMLPVTILLFRQMMMLYNSPHPRTTVVNIGLIAGTGALLYHPFWWMVPCIFWALAQMRPFRPNEWILLCLSFLLPVYVLLSYEFLTDQWNPRAHWPIWNPPAGWPPWNAWWVAAIFLTLVWAGSGFSQWQEANRRMLVQNRKNWYLLLMMGVFIMPSLFFPKANLLEGLTLLLLPVSALCANAFNNEKKQGLKLIFFWGIVLSAIIFSWAVLNQKM